MLNQNFKTEISENFGNRPKKAIVAGKGRNVKNSQIFEKKFLEPEASLTKMNFNENLKIAIALKIMAKRFYDHSGSIKYYK